MVFTVLPWHEYRNIGHVGAKCGNFNSTLTTYPDLCWCGLNGNFAQRELNLSVSL